MVDTMKGSHASNAGRKRRLMKSEAGPDPRLVALVKYLARRAAEQDYEASRATANDTGRQDQP